jgi:hypothetical protein
VEGKGAEEGETEGQDEHLHQHRSGIVMIAAGQVIALGQFDADPASRIVK